MLAEIITIGDELLIGQVVDTNSAWMGGHLSEIGVRVGRITSVSDEGDEIRAAISGALERAQIVLVTGGLGPTKDDITKHTLAAYFETPLVIHEPTLAFLQEYLGRRGIAVNELNHDQALVPACCTVIPNRNGTAPCMWFERDGRVLVSLPGVPYEMKRLMEEEVMPRIQRHFVLKSIVHRTVLTFGIAESILAERIAPWEEALPATLKLAYLPNPNGIRLRLSGYEVAGADCAAEITRQFCALRQLIGSAFVGYEPISLEEAVAQLLTERGESVGIAESCTGGYIASRFTMLPGASDYFKGCVVSYSNSVKETVLGVDRGELDRVGAVSRAVAEAMAQGARRVLGCTYAIATTGIAGPSGATDSKPVGLVWMAIDTPTGTFARQMLFGTLRDQNIFRSSAHAVNMLRLYLAKEDPSVFSDSIL